MIKPIAITMICMAGWLTSSFADPGVQLAQVNRNFTFRGDENGGDRKPPEETAPPEEEAVPVPPRANTPPPAETPPGAGPWQAGLNEFFDANLENPNSQDRLNALVAHLDRLTIRGVRPEEAYRQFEAALDPIRKRVPKDHPELEAVAALYKNLTTWIALEHAYTGGDQGTLRPLVQLVRDQAALDPGGDQDQWARVIQIIDQQKLFAPAVILFGTTVLPYRNVYMPPDQTPMEIAASPEFQDAPYESTATFEFLAATPPIFRIDFDTVGTQTAEVAVSDDGAEYTPVDIDIRDTVEGLKGPIILKTASRSKYLRVKVTSEPETAVLRNIRLFAFKSPAQAESQFVAQPPAVDGTFKDGGWTRQPQIDAMTAGEKFAENETTVWVCNTTDTLFFGVYAREPRMDTMVAAMDTRDAPIWDEESVEIVLRKENRPAFRFVVNPKGTQFDSYQDEAVWNGEWEAATQTFPNGWSAEIAIPFETVGGMPAANAAWDLQVIRHRVNVTKETSFWAPGPMASGKLRFK